MGGFEASDAEAAQFIGEQSDEMKSQARAWADHLKSRAERPPGGVWFFNVDPTDHFGYFSDRNGMGR